MPPLSQISKQFFRNENIVKLLSDDVDFGTGFLACQKLYTYRWNFVKFKGRKCYAPKVRY